MYLSERTISVPVESALYSRRMSCRVPQGSVFELILYNIFYDGLLRAQLPNGASLVGFADDIALVVINNASKDMEDSVNEALTRIMRWVSNRGIKLTHTKMEKVMLTRKWTYKQPWILFGGHGVILKRAVKYLGVTLGSRLTFTQLIRTLIRWRTFGKGNR